jgi:hypothetical protein
VDAVAYMEMLEKEVQILRERFREDEEARLSPLSLHGFCMLVHPTECALHSSPQHHRFCRSRRQTSC